MRTTNGITVVALTALTALVALAGGALAHESYDIGDGEYTVTVGDQNEPIYTYKWTNLDLIIRDSEGEPVQLEEDELDALDARLEAPGGEMLNRSIEGQYGEEGRYEFPEGHFYTQPGQYTLHLDGEIRGVDASGAYDLPGPRQAGNEFAFPHDDVPTLLDLQSAIDELRQAQQDNEQLEQRVQQLEDRISELEDEQSTLASNQEEIEAQANGTPGFGLGAGLAALAAVALVAARRR
jgi:PGF-CTERM protein